LLRRRLMPAWASSSSFSHSFDAAFFSMSFKTDTHSRKYDYFDRARIDHIAIFNDDSSIHVILSNYSLSYFGATLNLSLHFSHSGRKWYTLAFYNCNYYTTSNKTKTNKHTKRDVRGTKYRKYGRCSLTDRPDDSDRTNLANYTSDVIADAWTPIISNADHKNDKYRVSRG